MSNKPMKLSKNRGVSGAKQRGRASLAVTLQAAFPDEIHVDWYRTFMRGFVPMLVEDARVACGWKVIDHPTLRPTVDHMRCAQKELADRQFGMPAQMMHVKEEKEQFIKVSIEVPEVDELSEERKALIRQALDVKKTTYSLPSSSTYGTSDEEDDFDSMDVTDADFVMVPK